MKTTTNQQLPQRKSSSKKTSEILSLKELSLSSTTRSPHPRSSVTGQQQHEHQQPPSSGLSKDGRRSVLSALSLSSSSEWSHNHKGHRPNVRINNSNTNRTHHRNTDRSKSHHIHHRNENTYKTNNKKQQSRSSHQGHRALNQALVAAQSVSEVLSVLDQSAKLSEVGAGKSLNAVNFSTALHRLTRHFATTTTTTSNNIAPKQESQVLSDPRTALVLASIAECIVDPTIEFDAQALANIAWALAKLQLAPPLSTLPSALDRDNNHNWNSHKLLATTAATVRQIVTEAAQEAGIPSTSSSSTVAHQWTPALSQLAGYILDVIGETVLQCSPTSAMTPTPEQQQSAPRLELQSFEMQHLSNLLWAWATAGRANEQVFDVVMRSMIAQHSEKMRPTIKDPPWFVKSLPVGQDWSNAVWAVATAQCCICRDELLVYLAHLFEEYPDYIFKFKSQGLSNTLWGVATMLSNEQPLSADSKDGLSSTAARAITEREHQAALTILRHGFRSLVRRRANGFSSQNLSNSLWAAATLGFGLTAETSLVEDQQRNNYVVLKSRQPMVDAELMVDVVNVVVGASLPQLSRFRSQELSSLAWALARLVSDDNNQNVMKYSTESMTANVRALLEKIGRELADPRRVVNSQDVASTLWAMATLKFHDKDIYRGIASRLSPDQAHLYEPQHLSNTVWAFAKSEVEVDDIDVFDTSIRQYPRRPRDPVTVCFAYAAKELIRRPYQFEPQHVANILWALSKLGIRHPALFKAMAAHLAGSDDGSILARGLNEFSPQNLSNIAWAYARQAQLAQATISGGYGRLIVHKTIFSDVGEQLLRRLFRSISRTSVYLYNDLQAAIPQDISNTAWAFAVLGLKDTSFLEATKAVLIERSEKFVRGERNTMTHFNGQNLANLLWALATLNVSPGNMLGALMPCIRNADEELSAVNVGRRLNRQNLVNIAWACAVFGNYPDELMSFLYTGLLGPQGEATADPHFMESIHKDAGFPLQDVMTLAYVQADMDLRGCCQHLLLPVNFPDGWMRSKSLAATRDDPVTDRAMEKSLSTSSTQRAISAAFSRIGFHHIQEHTITMAEMAKTYGIRFPPKQIVVLSIDIANIESKIAIEVEGPSHYVTRIDTVDDADSASNKDGGNKKVVNGKLHYQFGWTGEMQEMNGATVLKERLLTSLGWNVIHIPFWDWEALGGDLSAEEKYCSTLLASCNVTE